MKKGKGESRCFDCRHLQESQIKGVYGCRRNVFVGATVLDINTFAQCKKFSEK